MIGQKVSFYIWIKYSNNILLRTMKLNVKTNNRIVIINNMLI